MSPSIPAKCKAAVIVEAGKPLEIKEVDVPKPQPGEILIKVEACGVCHSDAAVADGHLPMAKFPLIPGHEMVGRVVALGSNVTNWKEGDRAGGGWHGGHDGTCRTCNRGLFQMCDNEAINGVTRNGGYAEYATLRSEAAVRIPEDMDAAEVAPLLCAGVTVFNGIRQMHIRRGGVVVIQGLGGLGHLALQYSRKLGHRTVALSRDDKKKDFAMKLGATDYVATNDGNAAEAIQKLGGADLVIITAPNPDTVLQAIPACAPGAKILMLAPVGEAKIAVGPMIMKNISVHGWPSGHALDSEEAIDFAKVHDVNCMIERFPLDKANEAFQHMNESKIRFRGVLIP